MKKELLDKTLAAGIYDTAKYRYTARAGKHGELVIRRIAIDALDTTAALSDASDANPHGWEIVHRGDADGAYV